MSIRRSLAAVAVGVTVLFAGSIPAFAHVSTTPSEAPANGFATVFFQVPHGCNGSPTTKVAIQIPEGVTSVKPEAVAGWTAATTTTALDKPVTIEGKEVTTRASEVSWTGGPLANDQFQRFGVSMKLPDGKVGSDIVFPTVQTCTVGSTSWTDVAQKGQPEPDHPAPMITLTKTVAEGDGHGAPDSSMAGHDDPSTIAWIGVGIGAVGLVLGLTALIFATRKKSMPTA